jgi:putative transposase
MTGTGGLVFHVMNRGARRLELFQHADEYQLFLQAFAEAHERVAVDVFAYCLMPNHFHFILRPRRDGQLAEFMRLGTVTHSVRWHWRRGSSGGGCVYQGRYRAFPIQTDRYFLNACSYVEGNPLRSSLVSRAEEWPWSSLSARSRNCDVLPLHEWPILRPANWAELVNQRHSADDLTRIRRSLLRGRPLGDADWSLSVATSLRLSTGRSAGRPRNKDRELF